MRLADFDYDLPKELIAQYPAKERQKCRLMVLDRPSKTIIHKNFEDISEYFKKGDCLTMNNTRVIPARLFGKRKTGGKVELFILEKKNPVCEALVRPSGRVKEGEEIALESGDIAEILGKGQTGRYVKFHRPLDDILKETGHIPLPPYISRDDEASDRDDYQTIYGTNEGATASPTAGLHFTRELLNHISSLGVRISYVTLHTNYGTFAPIKTSDVESHRMRKEYFELPAETAELVSETKANGGRIFAVGTTTTRVLEHCADKITNDERVRSFAPPPRRGRYTNECGALLRLPEGDASGYTSLYIYPCYKFQIVDHLITNFHLPRSTLILLVSAFAGKDFILEAYRKAVEEKYRFFSYGDAMLIL